MKAAKKFRFLGTVFTIMTASSSLPAQKIQNIFFNLYTDSLKKGTFNYINVDGKMSNGSWLPLTANELRLTSTAGNFEGNSLFIDKDFKPDSIQVTAVVKNDTALSKTITIFIKKIDVNERLKTTEEINQEIEKKNRERKKRN